MKLKEVAKEMKADMKCFGRAYVEWKPIATTDIASVNSNSTNVVDV